MSQPIKYSELWSMLEPFAMTMLNDLQNNGKTGKSSQDAYAIILYNATAQAIKKYSVTEYGLSAALAAANAGDIVLLPACTISGNHTVPDEVSLVGIDRERCVLTGQVTLGENSLVGELSIVRSGSSGTVVGVEFGNTGARITGCIISVTNSGGDAIGVQATLGAHGIAEGCDVTVTGSGDSWGYYADGADITVESGSIDAAIPMEGI